MSKHNDIYNILGKLSSLQPKEENKPSILKEFAEPKPADVVQTLNTRYQEHKQLNESGLQAYLGKKKYGKEGMQALQKAGRDGASKEKMAMIRAKHDKMDEAVGQEGPADLLAAVEQEIARPGRSTDNLRDVLNATFGSDRSPEFKKARAVIGKYLDLVDNASVGSEEDGIAPMRGGNIARHIQQYDLTDYLQHAAAMLDKAVNGTMSEASADQEGPADLLAAVEQEIARPGRSTDNLRDVLNATFGSDRSPEFKKARAVIGKYLDLVDNAVMGSEQDGIAPMRGGNIARHIQQYDLTDYLQHAAAMLDKAVKGPMGEGSYNEDMLSPKQKKFAALADPKDKITYADKIAGAKKKEEGNEFGGELAKARAQGKDSFSVDGKDYPVKENYEDQHDIENKGEYDQEGDMAKDDLSTIEDAANELDSILSADDNLPEWVQSKINKAMDYLDTARDYMKANSRDDNPEMNEGEYMGAGPEQPRGKTMEYKQFEIGVLNGFGDIGVWFNGKYTGQAFNKSPKAVEYAKAFIDQLHDKAGEQDMTEGEYQDKVNKSKVPAFQRKAKGGDWKVSTKDLDDEASKSPTGRAGLEKAKERLRQQGVMERWSAPIKPNDYYLTYSNGAPISHSPSEEDMKKLQQQYIRSGHNDVMVVPGSELSKMRSLSEGFPTVDDAKKRAEQEKGTGKFDKQTTATGTRYTRKSDTYSDDGEETGSSDAPKKRGRPRKHTGPERVTGKAWKHKGGRKTTESIKLDTFVEDTIGELDALLLSEKAVSKQQQKFMGMVHAMQKGEKVKGASKELKAAAKGMSKKDAKDFAKTKHKGLPQKVSEGINFMEMMRETDQTVEEMLNELHAELDEYKTSGRMGDKLRDALDLHRHSKNRLMGETQDERKDFFHNPNVPDDEQLPALPQEVDVELNELARLAGLGEMDRSEYIQQQDASAERAGKDKFNAFGQTFDTDQVHEATCNMTAEGQMCPEHGFAECGGMYESAKPDFLDMDKDGDKKEPMKKALKDKEKQKVDECGDMSPMSNMSQSQSGMNVNTSFDTKTGRKTMSVTADGEAAEQLAQMLKMAGMGSGHSHNGPEKRVVMITPEQEVAEDFANEPNEQYADTESIISAGQDLNRKKQQYADKPKAGDNPMATENVQLEDRLAALYDSIKVKTR